MKLFSVSVFLHDRSHITPTPKFRLSLTFYFLFYSILFLYFFLYHIMMMTTIQCSRYKIKKLIISFYIIHYNWSDMINRSNSPLKFRLKIISLTFLLYSVPTVCIIVQIITTSFLHVHNFNSHLDTITILKLFHHITSLLKNLQWSSIIYWIRS